MIILDRNILRSNILNKLCDLLRGRYTMPPPPASRVGSLPHKDLCTEYSNTDCTDQTDELYTQTVQPCSSVAEWLGRWTCNQ